jgi:hypothetical protein
VSAGDDPYEDEAYRLWAIKQQGRAQSARVIAEPALATRPYNLKGYFTLI